MIKAGDTVEIKPEWQDGGDSQYTWFAVDDEEKGRVTISPIDRPATFPGTQTVRVDMLVKGA